MPLQNNERHPDRETLKTFVGAMFRHAGTDGFVSLRAFYEGATKPFRITPVSMRGGSEFLCEVAADDAFRAANAPQGIVFCPPLAVFTNAEHARQRDLLRGLALSVECDQRAREAAATLEKLLGPATMIVRSGGKWTDPKTGQSHDRLHVHYRLSKPAQGEGLIQLKRARVLATEIVGGDASNKPTVHPIRWPGSWHRKGEPRLCEIETHNPDAEIDLDTALAALEAAAPKKKAKANGKANGGTYTPQPGDDERIAGALAFIDADERAVWIEIGMALHTLGEKGREMWDRWSATSDKYDPADSDRVWDSFDESGGITIATLFLRAIKYGWNREAEEEDHPAAGPAERRAPPPPCSLDDLHGVFRKWFGEEYDLDAIDAVVATGAAERLDGDPLWLLIVSGPGAAKTETVQALSGCGAHVTSTIQSEGALLSATSKQGRVKGATGGLLRKIGAGGILVIKDVTTILSSVRDARATVLAALREVYDGRYERNVGSDGGQTLTWEGRIAIVGAVTTVWDSAHAVVAAMGDRFVLLRIDSDIGREESGMRSISNTGSEVRMRKELAGAVGGIVAHASMEVPALTIQETRRLVKAADIVTMNRTAVERDFQGNVVNSHAPEMPTRFAKQLAQILRGGIAVGMSRKRAMELAIRCARDSIPPLRRAIILDVASHPDTNPGDVRKRLNKPWTTVKREMEGLHMLGTLHCDEDTIRGYGGGKDKTVWRYRLAPEFDRVTLDAMAGKQDDDDVII
jgi:Primase C terminal 2 (PriCT-2)